MKTRILLLLTLLIMTSLALGQTPLPASVPACNGFDSTGTVPMYFAPNTTTGTTACTDYFGKANYANSPLPIGPVDTSVTGFTIMDGGSNYTNPTLTITDFYGMTTSSIACTATLSGGMIIGVASCTASTPDFMAPVVGITDTTGSGAIVLAKLASASSGGLHKFVDALPDLKAALATSDTLTFPGSTGNPAADFYVIGLVQYTTNLHADLPPTTVRGYCQLAAPTYTTCTGTGPVYLGPVILATKDRPVRVLFKNMLPPGTAGNLFIPVDTTYMGAGVNPDGQPYLQNRATLHLHGGATPWISDGTPHQWTAPATDWQTPINPPFDPAADNLNRGVSTRFVPDMWFDASGNLIQGCQEQMACIAPGATNDPGPGNMTFYWTNQQGGRLMFYHDHAYGLTRLNVYVGEAAGYLLYDPIEEAALAAGTAPGTITGTPDLAHIIPLVIQDKTFVPSQAQLLAEDPTWNMISGGGTTPGTANLGDFWFPHVYMPNQNPNDFAGGSNAFGRWDYGPWFFPPQTTLTASPTITIPCTSAAFPNTILAPTGAHPAAGCPIIPNPSGTPEGFMDTPVVNGKAYPVLHVAPEAYRFHILTAANDRTLNLSLYLACGFGGSAAATNCADPRAIGTEVPMVPAVRGGTGTAGYTYPDQLDGRDGGVPDITARGPSWIQIGTEGGLLPNVAVIPPTPIGYEYGRRSITVMNISNHGLLLGPAERADVVVDFTGYAKGTTLILYNDAPAPVPAFDSRIDYYTGDPDQVETGGAPSTIPGYGPNTRTIMQIVVDGTPSGAAFSLATLQGALPAAFKATQPVPVVPEPTYPVASGGNATTESYAGIQDNSLTFTPAAPLNLTEPCNPPSVGCVNFDQKAIQELFTLDYGRMNATMGTELPLTNFQTQTTIPYGYVDWPTEIFQDGQTQLWKLTHNGVDTHFIHFHLFNVQVINRIGWDGVVKPPDANELGWKDTVRMNPLEDIVFALQPISQKLPFPLPDSVRSMDVTVKDSLADMNISGLDPMTGNATITNVNQRVNFGWEYVWHCHILGHEENDMMRPMIFQVAPPAPSNLVVSAVGSTVQAAFTDNSASESSFTLERSLNDPTFAPANTTAITIAGSVPSASFGTTLQYPDSPPPALPTDVFYYRVRAEDNFQPTGPLQAPFSTQPMSSTWSNTATLSVIPIAGVAPTTLNFGTQLVGTTSSPQTVTLSNTGSGALGSIVITTTGDYAQTSTCLSTLAGGSTCSIAVTFTPTAMLARPGTLVITSNDPVNPTLTVVLSGSGIANTATALSSNSPITYGADGTVTVNVTSAQITPVAGSVTLSVDGGAPLSQALVSGSATFTLTAPTAGNHSLSAGFAAQGGFQASSATATLVVNPAPLTITASSAAMTYGGAVPTITPIFGAFVLGQNNLTALTTQPTCSTTASSISPASPPTVPSTCSGAVAPNYKITYVAGAVTINKATTTTTIVTNLPNPSIVGQIVTVKFAVGPQFTGTPTGNVTVMASTRESCTGALTAGVGSCTLTFSTGGARTLTATYVGDGNFLTSTSASANQTVSGISVSTSSLLFGNQLVGTTSAAQTVTVANVGTTTINISNITWSAGFSDSTNCIGNLAPGRNCRINVRFAPTTTGVINGTLTITDTDPASPQGVALTGTGVAPVLTLSTNALPFGNQAVRTTSPAQTVTVTNTGTAPLVINGININGSNANMFGQTNNCPGSLAAGANCTISVTFRPNSRGGKSANLNVNVAAPATSQSVTLTGSGV